MARSLNNILPSAFFRQTSTRVNFPIPIISLHLLPQQQASAARTFHTSSSKNNSKRQQPEREQLQHPTFISSSSPPLPPNKSTPSRHLRIAPLSYSFSNLNWINRPLVHKAVLIHSPSSTPSHTPSHSRNMTTPSKPEEVMVIREVVPGVTTLSVPFLRFDKIKFGGRATIGMFPL